MLKNIRARLSKVLAAGFVRNVSVLVGGTAIAQALTVLILPFLTRLYSPGDFAALAAYASILGILASIACLRLEIAIPIPEQEEEAADLLLLALTIATTIAMVVGLTIWVYPAQIIAFTGQPALAPYLWLLPLGIWFSGVYAALQYWSTRQKQFSLIARTRVSQAGASAVVQLSFGWAGLTPVGLLLGQLANSGAGIFKLSSDTWRHHRKALLAVRLHTMLRTLRRYDRFPKYSTLEALANSAGLQLPILIIAALAVGPEAGFLMLASRVMAAPMALIGGAVSQVYLSRAPEERRQGRLASFTSTILSALVKTGVGPLIFIGIIAPFAFPIVFGTEWTRAGQIVSWMTPWFIFQLLASPVSMILHVTNNQRTAFFLQITGFIIRVGFVFIAFYIAPQYIVEAYAVSGFIFYFIYLIIVLNIAGISYNATTLFNLKNWLIIIIWTVIAGAAAYSFEFAQVYFSHAPKI